MVMRLTGPPLACVQEHGWKEVVYDTGFQAKVFDWVELSGPVCSVWRHL